MKETGKDVERALGTGGFTLVEVIIAITLAAVLGTIVVQFSGTALSMSGQTVARVRNGYALEGVMEKITRDYRIWLEEYPGAPISDFEERIRSNAEYSGFIDDAQTGTESTYFVDNADSAIDLLQLTLTDGGQRLVALFTK